jgi:hypothetical protein
VVRILRVRYSLRLKWRNLSDDAVYSFVCVFFGEAGELRRRPLGGTMTSLLFSDSMQEATVNE